MKLRQLTRLCCDDRRGNRERGMEIIKIVFGLISAVAGAALAYSVANTLCLMSGVIADSGYGGGISPLVLLYTSVMFAPWCVTFALPQFALLIFFGHACSLRGAAYCILSGLSVALIWVQSYDCHIVLADPRLDGGGDATPMDYLIAFTPGILSGGREFGAAQVALHLIPAGIAAGFAYWWVVERGECAKRAGRIGRSK